MSRDASKEIILKVFQHDQHSSADEVSSENGGETSQVTHTNKDKQDTEIVSKIISAFPNSYLNFKKCYSFLINLVNIIISVLFLYCC
jgi:hypothetical protein